MNKSYYDAVFEHYRNCWNVEPNIYLWERGPVQNLPFEFRVLEFAPSALRKMWTYATCGMSNPEYENPIELHMFSSEQDSGIVELLTAITYYHSHSHNLDIRHTVNFGRPWRKGSACEYGLISLPYLDGPSLENLAYANKTIKFYWLVPVTKTEVEYKKKHGMESLEERFESSSFNYLDPLRRGVV